MRSLSAVSVLILIALLVPVDHLAGVSSNIEMDSVAGVGQPQTPGAKIRAEVEAAAGLLGIDVVPLVQEGCPGFEEAVRAHFAYFGLVAPPTIPSLNDEALEQAIACLLDAQRVAGLARDLALAGTDYQALVPLVLSDDPATYEQHTSFALDQALGAALHFADQVDLLLAAAAASQRGLPAVPMNGPAAAPEIDLEPVLAVDRLGDTLYDKDYALIVDLVGNDLYDNNAGGGMIAIGGGALIPPTGNTSTWQHVVAPAGTGAPHVVVGGQFEDSEAIIAAAIAIDTDGDDTYGVYKTPGRDGQCTDEKIVRRVVLQGAGVLGASMLIDTAGDNELHARVLGQGLGHVGGVGILYLGTGNDQLTAARSAQGSGVFGGVGILLNEGGDDAYVARVPEGGTLNADLGFCDAVARYVQGSGFGRVTGIAAGVLGVLRDEAGNDTYRTDIKGQGFGMVYGHGILLELGGNDVYSADSKAMGYAEGHASTGGLGLGILYEAGGNDVYGADHAPAIGMAAGRLPTGDIPPPSTPVNLWLNDVIAQNVDPLLLTSGAFLWDRAGDDTYGLAERWNGQTDATGGFAALFVDEAP